MMPLTWYDALPFAAMVMIEITDVVSATISKAAMSKGMSPYVFTVYSNFLGTILLLPCFIFQKKVSLTFSLLGGQFLLGLLGSISLLLQYNGIKYSSPALASAIGNLIPVFTFLLAIIFRMEKLDLRRSSCRAKLFGTIVSVSGAFIVILYKGVVIFSPSSSLHQNSFMMISSQSKWIIGGLMSTIASFLTGIWIISQASLVVNCPSMTTVVFVYTLLKTIICAVFSLFIERDWIAWELNLDIEMVSIVFTAIFVTVGRIGVHTWCLQQKGAIFVAMFRPLGTAIAAAMVVIFLGESVYLGSVIGSVTIAFGFYAVMWAQMKEKNTSIVENDVQCLASSTQKTPLLQCSTSRDEV